MKMKTPPYKIYELQPKGILRWRGHSDTDLP